MKNFENFGLVELNTQEVVAIDGGIVTAGVGCGCAWGHTWEFIRGFFGLY